MLKTDRLLLRRWREEDRSPFALINANSRVMEFMPALLSKQESDRVIDRFEEHFKKHTFGLWAAELLRDHSLIGFIGLSVPTFTAAFTPCVEIGWRLSADHWGQGLATEGAHAVVRYALEVAAMRELVSFTAVPNQRSRRVMEKLGMIRNPEEDFDHPSLPLDHPLRRHVLYRLVL